jgi:TPR repeat protein
LELAFTCSLASARAGYVKAQYLTGQCYELGEGVEKSDTDASHWYPHIEPFYIRQFLY